MSLFRIQKSENNIDTASTNTNYPIHQDTLSQNNFLLQKISVDSVNRNFFAKNTQIELKDSKGFLALTGKPFKQESYYSTAWFLGILIISLGLLAYLHHNFSKYIKQIFDSLYNIHSLNRLCSDRNVFYKRTSLLLNMLFILVGSGFLFEISEHYQILITTSRGFDILFFSAVLVVFILYYFLISYSWGALFETNKSLTLYYHNFSIFNKVISIVLLPLILIFPYLQFEQRGIILVIGFFLIGFIYLFRILRGFQIVLTERVSFFYLFAYLCTFEIIPLAFVYKVYIQIIS
jgi:hypothetical protein